MSFEKTLRKSEMSLYIKELLITQKKKTEMIQSLLFF